MEDRCLSLWYSLYQQCILKSVVIAAGKVSCSVGVYTNVRYHGARAQYTEIQGELTSVAVRTLYFELSAYI